MYPVSAPANACDSHETQDNEKQHPKPATCELKLVYGPQSERDFQKTLRSIDASELAAKILQLHAAADEKAAAEGKRPKMIDDQSDELFEMPNVLQKTGTADKSADVETVPEIQVDSSSAQSDRSSSGPSFKFLVLTTLMIGVAGGAALAFGVPQMLGASDDSSRAVQTEVITTDPSLEAPSVASTSGNQASPQSQSAPVSADRGPVATPAEIAKAKERIQRAFAVGGTTALTQAATTQAALTEAAQTRAALAEPVRNMGSTMPPAVTATDTVREVSNASDPEISRAVTQTVYPLVASAAPSVPVPEISSAPPAATNSPAEGNLVEPEARVTAVSNAPALPVPGDNSAITSQAFPNEGKTTAAVNFRLTEDKDGTIIAVIPKNTEVSYNECGIWWCGVQYEGQTGFVGKNFLNRSAP